MSKINSQILTDLISDRLASEYNINPSLLHDSTAAAIIDNLVNELNKANNKVDAVNAEMLDTNSKLAKGIKVAEAVRDALRDDTQPKIDAAEPDTSVAPAEQGPGQVLPELPELPNMPQEPTAPMPDSTPVNPNVLEGVGGGY